MHKGAWMKVIYEIFGENYETDIGLGGMQRAFELHKAEMEKEKVEPTKNGFLGWYKTEFGRIELVKVEKLV